MRPGSLVVLALAGCQPGGSSPVDEACGEVPEAPIVRLACREDLVPGGLATAGDYLLADPHVRLLVGRGGGSVNFAGLDGATGLDLATWDGEDQVDEIIPVVRGGWLEVTGIYEDGVELVVSGIVRAISGLRDPDDEGDQAEVRWSVQDGAVVASGADVLWVRGLPGVRFDGRSLLRDGWALSGSSFADDLGGAVTFQGNTLYVEGADAAWIRRHPEGARAKGTTDGDGLEVMGDEGGLGIVPLRGTEFSLRLPPEATGVRAIRTGHAPGPTRPPSGGMRLETGPSGSVSVEIVLEGRPRSVQARWSGPAGVGASWVDPEGGTLPTGPGDVVVTLDERPYPVNVPPGGEAVVEHTALEVVPEPWVFVGFATGGADRSSRANAADLVDAASASGQHLTVVVARDRVPSVDEPAARAGIVARTSEGHSLLAWPFQVQPRRAGQGAPDLNGRTTLQALAAAGADRRVVIVQERALYGLPAPWATDPAPSMVFVGEPEAGPGWWGALGTWWSAGRALVPVGPVNWVRAPGDDPSPAAVEQAWLRGRVSAGSGPRLDLVIAGARPGDVLQTGPLWPVPLVAEVTTTTLDRGQRFVWTDLGSIEVDANGRAAIPSGAKWAAAVEWRPGGGPWAVTGPVWLRTP